MITLEMPRPARHARIPSRWQAVLNRDPSKDGRFVFAVRTTGIFCRPSCPARRPKQQNVEFFADPTTARAAGYRPCRRCHPEAVAVDRVSEARALVEADPSNANLVSLAKQVGLSPSHLQRRFKARFGVSPKELALAGRSRRLKSALRQSGSVARAGYDAGYSSSSGVYEEAAATLGMTPAAYAKGGQGQLIRFVIKSTALGLALVAATDRGLCAVLLGTTEAGLIESLRLEFPAATLDPIAAYGDPLLLRAVDQIAADIAGRPTAADAMPLDFHGTEFQIRVWKELIKIPRGEHRSYAEVARAIGRPRSVRAVANAIGSNRLAVVVPCHRVIRGDGSLGGYRWGEPLKKQLIEVERQAS
jgi:AraC family transcriptional regulator of adaptative response/methylated-DNA-[protein]-cysteine methyltransferase